MILPRITIVTPSFNQGTFLEATIRSVLSTGYPNLRYIIIDGGSTDGSVDLIRRHAGSLSHWVSEPDQGQYHAINKGFQAAQDSDILAWLNADDLIFPWTLATVAEIFQQCPDVDWLTALQPATIDEPGRIVRAHPVAGFGRESFLEGRHCVGDSRYIGATLQQESTFFRRRLWLDAGGQINQSYTHAADFELWCRFLEITPPACLDGMLGCFRLRSGQRSTDPAYAEQSREALHQLRNRTGWQSPEPSTGSYTGLRVHRAPGGGSPAWATAPWTYQL